MKADKHDIPKHWNPQAWSDCDLETVCDWDWSCVDMYPESHRMVPKKMVEFLASHITKMNHFLRCLHTGCHASDQWLAGNSLKGMGLP